MGSYDGAQVCELVDLCILSLLMEFISQQDVGLYCDDGLIVVKKLNGKQTDRLRKPLVSKLTLQQIYQKSFLDVNFNLLNGAYRLYKKTNDEISYINTLSNHPPQVIIQLPSIEE